jgi:hypothetical protein
MATPPKKYLAALDPQFVLFLEAGSSDCKTIFDGLAVIHFEFILTETGLQEIQELAENGSRQEIQNLAKRVLPRLRSHYGIKTPGLKNYENGCAEVIANHLLEKCLREDALKNDALLVSEASLHECNFLVMLANPFVSVDHQKINLLMAEKGGNPLTIIGTEEVLQIFDQPKT